MSMEVTSVIVGLRVSDLAAARTWYETAFELRAPDLVVDDHRVDHAPGLIDSLDFTDPDGNALSLSTVLATEG